MRAIILAVLLVGIQLRITNAADNTWPPLPKTGFISGRTAVTADIAAGNAVFVAQTDGTAIGKPLAIKIPQYAYYVAEKKKVPVIILQAEEAQGMKLVGAKYLNGGHVISLITDFELLGIEAK